MMELAFTGTSSFAGVIVPRGKSVCRSSTSVRGPCMSLSRREALSGAAGAAAAALLAGVSAAMAKSGDSPKISVFGVGGASSPYTAGVQQSGTVQYKTLNEDEIDAFKSKVSAAGDRLASTIDPIKGKSWDDVKSRIRLEMYEVRNIVLKVNAGIEDKKTAKEADALYAKFKTSIEALDYAAVTKNQSKALSSYQTVVSSYGEWRKLVGL